MPTLRIALAQVNPTVGDLEGNARIVVEQTRLAAEAGARLVVFPEMMITGYPVEDLALRTSFVDASIAMVRATAELLAVERLGGIAVLTGYLDRREGLPPRVGLPAGAPLDAVALLYNGVIQATSAKHHLPNYGVFDEYRYFVPGDRVPVFRLPATGGEVDVAVAVCEDLWQEGGPVQVACTAGAGLLAVPNASPYERGKEYVRQELSARRAREAGAALAYANMIGGQDELVFDGGSLVVDATGRLIACCPRFSGALVVADLDLPAADPRQRPGDTRTDAGDGTAMTIHRLFLEDLPDTERLGAGRNPEPPATGADPQPLDDLAEVYSALVLGTADYVRKNGFRSVILALSGGIDSALTATIAADAIGPDRVHAVLMPSRYSSDHSVTDAEDLIKRQGLHARTVPIQSMVDAFEAELEGLGGLAAENLQARIRGMTLMSLSNQEGHLVLTTGNKSEIATGYSTLYGDSAGGFAPIKDVFKTLVWDLARWRNEQAAAAGQVPPIPEHSISKPPSAELAPGQLDSDSLPDYAVLDALLDDYVENDLGAAQLVAAGHDPQLVERVIRMVDAAEYKRRQYPPGPKITPKNFGRDRRLPITSRWRECL
ncbi:MAG TPA: NAD+ synthase [Streptosporangiaceae bacterium]|nr:NAD+ synthase [Streptosporangiaceae bacterium]